MLEKARYPIDSSALAVKPYEDLLEWIFQRGYDRNDENFKGTAERAAKGFAQLILSKAQIEEAVDAMVMKAFPATYSGMVTNMHNFCIGCCPHHLLPVIMRISVAYIPAKKVLGISKLSRMAWLLARQPILQEQITDDLADILYKRIDSKGSGVHIEALHLCMAARGIEAYEARVVTSTMRGAFMDQQVTRAEFMDLVNRNKPSLIP